MACLQHATNPPPGQSYIGNKPAASAHKRPAGAVCAHRTGRRWSAEYRSGVAPGVVAGRAVRVPRWSTSSAGSYWTDHAGADSVTGTRALSLSGESDKRDARVYLARSVRLFHL